MARNVELRIRRWLLSNMSLQTISERLAEMVINENVPLKEKTECLKFMLNSGYDSDALVCFPRLFRDKQLIPWGCFLLLLEKHIKQLKREVIESLIKGIRRQKASAELLVIHGLDHLDSRFSELRSQAFEQLSREDADRKKTLFERYEFLKAQLMLKEEGETLKLLQRLFPGDPDVLSLEQDFSERWARHILQSRRDSDHDRDNFTESDLTADALRLLQLWESILTDEAQKSKQHSFDIAMFFFFMECYEECHRILGKCPPHAASDWLIAESLLRDQRYIEALEQLNDIALRYPHDPETQFGVSYYKAIAYFGLRQFTQGLEVLQALKAIRPHYRSTERLLELWSKKMGGKQH